MVESNSDGNKGMVESDSEGARGKVEFKSEIKIIITCKFKNFVLIC